MDKDRRSRSVRSSSISSTRRVLQSVADRNDTGSPPLFTTFLKRKTSSGGKEESKAPRQADNTTMRVGDDEDVDSFIEPSLAALQARRGSEMSNASSSQAGPSSNFVQFRRTSLSSFASSTGSPRPTVSTMSHATNGTVGDMSSTASLPLLQGMTPLAGAGSEHSYPPPSSKSRTRAGTSSSRDSSRRYSASRGGLPPVTNPFAPLRKRLRRTLFASANKRLAIELQLLVELVDALDMLIAASMNPPETLPSGRTKAEESMSEVETLLGELIEAAPDAKQCLMNGQYGPMAGGVHTLKRDSYDPSWSEWWPRRLARDCRAVLDELGFPTTMLTVFATPLEEDDKAILGYVTPPITPPTQSKPVVDALLGGGEDSTNQILSKKTSDGDVSKKKRQEELLVEGQRRWQAYLAQMERTPNRHGGPDPPG